MARLTFDELVTQGGLIGQNDGVDSWIGIKLKAWLRKHYAAWAWPFLIRQATGISLAAGTTSLAVGAAQGGLTNQISRIFSPIYYRSPSGGFLSRGTAPVRTMVGDSVTMADGMVDSSVQVGKPQSFLVAPGQTAAGLLYMTLTPFPVPEQAYTLAFTYQYLPGDPAGSDVPVYPNEMTLIQAAKVAALEYDQTNDPVYRQEADILAQMVAADRAAYGGTPSFGDTMQLDSSVFLP